MCKYCNTFTPGGHRDQKRDESPRIRIANNCELPYWCWERNLISAVAGKTLNH